MKNIIKVENISYKKNNNLILDSIDLEIEQGEFVSILGPTGSGKTSLVNLLLGNEVPCNGSINIFGTVVNDIKKDYHIRAIFENTHNHFVTNKVINELYYPLRKMKLSDEEIEFRVEQIVSSLNMKDILEYIPSSLSSGEKALVSFAKEVIIYPDVLIIDEVFEMIDEITKEKIFSLLKKLQKEKNMTILYVTQNIEDTLYTERLLLLSHGKISLDSKLKDAFNDEKVYRNAGICFPFVVNLSKKLQYYGLVDKIEFNMSKLVNKLWK